MVSPFEAFEAYQRHKAWVWEHQALTRARHVAATRTSDSDSEALRREILREKRDPDMLKREITAMRTKMLDAHPNRSALFDLKHDRGGIIDVEFIVQHWCSRTRACTQSSRPIPAICADHAIRAARTDSRRCAQAVHAAYRTYRQLQHGLRLRGEPMLGSSRRPSPARSRPCGGCGTTYSAL